MKPNLLYTTVDGKYRIIGYPGYTIKKILQKNTDELGNIYYSNVSCLDSEDLTGLENLINSMLIDLKGEY